jgi:hypothetical protein
LWTRGGEGDFAYRWREVGTMVPVITKIATFGGLMASISPLCPMCDMGFSAQSVVPVTRNKKYSDGFNGDGQIFLYILALFNYILKNKLDKKFFLLFSRQRLH